MKQTTSNRLVRLVAGRWLAALLFPALAIAAETPFSVSGGTDGNKPDSHALVWDAEFKDYTTKPGERYAQFTFWFTNVASTEVVIRSARSSCFCTVAKLPEQPWSIAPGKGGPIEVTLDLLGKGGTVSKAVM